VVVFALNGLCFAPWVSRIPAMRDALSLSTGQLGLLLLCLSGGACAAMPLSGPAVHRLGAARVVLLGACGVGLGLVALAVGIRTVTVGPAAVGLLLVGVGNSHWVVGMNVAGAEVERRRGRTLMPRLHAAFSIGTVIGGAAGAVPVLVGWSAVTDSLAWTPVVLFAIIFIWTPPHFWSLAVKYKDDYEAANVPMLPVVSTFTRTARQIFIYTVLLVATSLVLASVGHLGWLYIVAATGLGAVFLLMSAGLWRRATPKLAMRLFSYSITYLTLLFVVMAVDVFVQHR